jgi:hypothetical protein
MATFDPLLTLAEAAYAPSMRSSKLICALAAFTTATGCDVQKVRHHENQPAETAGPHFANLCLARSDWLRLLSTMRTFGVEHGLEMHGGIENDSPDGPTLNAYLAQGYSYYFGDEFDIWFVSDPFRKNVVTVNGVLKHKPITRQQQALSDGLLSDLSTFTRRASGPEGNPTCV